LCEAWRTAMLVVLKAGDDRRSAERAVSMVAMAGEEPVGSARILGSNMVGLCVCLRCPAVDSMSLCSLDFRLSAASAICVENKNYCWQRSGHLT
jgi:hypothetical protein